MNKNIIIGIDETTDIQQLLSLGIKQFYFGYLPQNYFSLYGSQTSLNRRYRIKEQFTNLDTIYKTIQTIQNNNATIYLALNSFTSNDIMLEYSKELYELFYKKVDAIIVANITVAQFLKQQNYKKIVLSNLFGIYTTQAVSFFKKQFNPYKMILPRDIRIEDLQKIVTTFPDDKFECFLYGDNCRYSESFCFSEHGYDSTGFGSLCSFAFTNKKPIHSANTSFKQIVKHSKLTKDEKASQLQKKELSIEALLNDIELNIYKFNSKNIAKSLEMLNRYDINYLMESKPLFIRVNNLLRNLEFKDAKEILKKIEDVEIQDINYYTTFHKLNPHAIVKTMEFFSQHENIVSYKIPSRGRDMSKFLSAICSVCVDKQQMEYDYTKSQYQL